MKSFFMFFKPALIAVILMLRQTFCYYDKYEKERGITITKKNK